MTKRPYDFERNFRRPVSKAIAAHMAQYPYIAKDGRFVSKDGQPVGALPIRMVVDNEAGPVYCEVHVVFSPTLARIFNDFTRFAVDNYAAAQASVARKATE